MSGKWKYLGSGRDNDDAERWLDRQRGLGPALPDPVFAAFAAAVAEALSGGEGEVLLYWGMMHFAQSGGGIEFAGGELEISGRILKAGKLTKVSEKLFRHENGELIEFVWENQTATSRKSARPLLRRLAITMRKQ